MAFCRYYHDDALRSKCDGCRDFALIVHGIQTLLVILLGVYGLVTISFYTGSDGGGLNIVCTERYIFNL